MSIQTNSQLAVLDEVETLKYFHQARKQTGQFVLEQITVICFSHFLLVNRRAVVIILLNWPRRDTT